LDGVDDEFLITFFAPVEKRFKPTQDDAAGKPLKQSVPRAETASNHLELSLPVLAFFRD
jgi:hypothetical protein